MNSYLYMYFPTGWSGDHTSYTICCTTKVFLATSQLPDQWLLTFSDLRHPSITLLNSVASNVDGGRERPSFSLCEGGMCTPPPPLPWWMKPRRYSSPSAKWRDKGCTYSWLPVYAFMLAQQSQGSPPQQARLKQGAPSCHSCFLV